MSENPASKHPLMSLNLDELQLRQLEKVGFESVQDLVLFFQQSLGCGSFVPIFVNGVSLVDVDCHVILARLKDMNWLPNASTFEDVTIDRLDLSQEGKEALYRVGFTTLHEMVWTLEQILVAGPMFEADWIKYSGELFRCLRNMGVWPSCHSVLE